MENCRVPASNVLGEVGGGLTHMMRNLEIERLTLAAMSLGIADRCLEMMVQYGRARCIWSAHQSIWSNPAFHR